MRLFTFTVAFAAFAILASTRPAAAQSEREAAITLFDEGRSALQRGDVELACSKFAESNRVDPAVGTAFNLANCEEQRGRLATAWKRFREVAGRMKADDPRLAVAQERIASLGPRVPRIILVGEPQAPPGTHVRVDDRDLDSATFGAELPLDPGPHRILIRVPNTPTRAVDFTLSGSETLKIPLTNAADTPTSAKTEPPGPLPNANDDRPEEHRILGVRRTNATLVAAGVGVAGLAVGLVAGVVGLNAQDTGNANCSALSRTCTQQGYDANQRAKTMAVVSSVGFVVGIAAGGAATYLYFTARSPATSSQTASVGLRGTW